ncbi:cupin domain-containing protein [Hymenobacter fodinae]|uniref:Cupin domain-containing protein n=1 Tax=Hymenobacter fodinae TaxID=2510796 RepID=A0A4Z0NZD5_9BACT|nr:cupin domain-containing protein [Hymenobacter fodinae]TGE03779.1 cupin domain-containing protein [Hymenobacter fodinae]
MNQSYWLLGTLTRILADDETTEGRYDLIEGTFQPGVATPMHRHTAYSELLFGLEGEFTVPTNAGVVVVKPGENFFIPRGTVHAVVSGPGLARGLVVASPSGFARLLKAAGTPADSTGLLPTTPPDMAAFAQASAEVGDEVIGPPRPAGSRLRSLPPAIYKRRRSFMLPT